MFKQCRAWLRKPKTNVVEQWLDAIIKVVPLVFLIRTFGFGLYQVPSGSMETTMLKGERFFADKLTVWLTPIQRGEIISFNEPTFEYSKNFIKNAWQMYAWGPSNWTKRVIGIPGDHVQGKIEDGKPVVYLNGVKLDEPYVNKWPLIYVWSDGKHHPQQELYLRRVRETGLSYDPQKPYNDQPFYTVNPQSIIRVQNVPFIVYPDTVSEERDVFDVQLGDNEYWVMGDNRQGSWDSRGWGKLSGKLIHGRIVFRILSIDSDYSWLPIDILVNPISFWKKVRWSRCLQFVK